MLRGGMVDDQGLSSLTLLQRTDALPENGRVELELGTTPFASREGECRLDIDYLVEDSGMLGLSGGCETYDQAGRAASVSVGLDLVGCTVAR